MLIPLETSTPLGDGRGVVRIMRRVGWTRRRRALVGRSHDGVCVFITAGPITVCVYYKADGVERKMFI